MLEVTVKVWGITQSVLKKKKRLQWERFAEKEGYWNERESGSAGYHEHYFSDSTYYNYTCKRSSLKNKNVRQFCLYNSKEKSKGVTLFKRRVPK